MLLISGVVIAMGVSVVWGLARWLQILGLALGLILVVAGLAIGRTFRSKDPEQSQK